MIKRWFTAFYELVKTIQQARAEAVIKGHFWY
jgi:hypothetical protein